MSSFETAIQRLEEWGRAARQHDPIHLEPGQDAAIPLPIYEMYRSFGDDVREPGWGDPVPPDPPLPPIDEKAVDAVDFAILALGRRSRKILVLWYWRRNRRAYSLEEHDAAVRAFADELYYAKCCA